MTWASDFLGSGARVDLQVVVRSPESARLGRAGQDRLYLQSGGSPESARPGTCFCPSRPSRVSPCIVSQRGHGHGRSAAAATATVSTGFVSGRLIQPGHSSISVSACSLANVSGHPTKSARALPVSRRFAEIYPGIRLAESRIQVTISPSRPGLVSGSQAGHRSRGCRPG